MLYCNDTRCIAVVELKKKTAEYTPQGGISVREEATAPTPTEWSQVQQKALESALSTVPKTLPDRWADIAELVPGKSKVILAIVCCMVVDILYRELYFGHDQASCQRNDIYI